MGYSVAELKAQLAARGIDFSHCIEKAELQKLLGEAEHAEGPCREAREAEHAEGPRREHDASEAAPAFVGSGNPGGSLEVPAPSFEPGVQGGRLETPAPSTEVGEPSEDELRAELVLWGIDFAHCKDKGELQELLLEARREQQWMAPPSAASTGHPAEEASVIKPGEAELSDGCFARKRGDACPCWVEFLVDENALCHWSDGTNSILTASDLEAVREAELTRFSSFKGPFEAARAEAFYQGRLLVASVQQGGVAMSSEVSKSYGLQALVLASEDVVTLIHENAIFWRGNATDLREVHRQQLAPSGEPGLAMVLPVAADAMRVLSHSPGTNSADVVSSFVSALEALEAHRDAKQARLLSEDAQLRMWQDEEFAAGLATDRAAEEARRAGCGGPFSEPAGLGGPGAGASATSLGELGMTDAGKHTEMETDVSKRPAAGLDECEDGERLAKTRRLLADEFLSNPSPPDESVVARLVLRLPTGERVERIFGAQEPFSRVRRWAECCPLLPESNGRSLHIPAHFEIATAFPPKQFCPDEYEKTLAELNLAPSAALLLISCDD